MSPARRVVGFALRAAAIYAVALLLWAAVGTPFRVAFEGFSEFALGVVSTRVDVEYLPLDEPAGDFDTRLAVANRAAGVRRSTPVSVRQLAYIPLCAVLALVLATPVSWSRRRRAAWISAVLVLVFAVGRVGLKVLYEASDEGLGLITLSPGVRSVLENVVHAVFHSVVASVAIPVVVWAFVTFRAGDLRRLLHGTPSEQAAA